MGKVKCLLALSLTVHLRGRRSRGVRAVDLKRAPSAHIVTPAEAGVQESSLEAGIEMPVFRLPPE